MPSTVANSIVLIALFAIAIGAIAFIGTIRRSVSIFLVLVVLLWGGISLSLGYYSSVTSLVPSRIPAWRHVAAIFLGIAPLILIPAALTIAPVLGRMEPRRIPLLAVTGAVMALPITFMSAIASTCYVAFDCP